jgi:hypothetical protein
MRTTACLYRADPFRLQSLVPNQELSIFFGEDIVCYRSEAQSITEVLTQSKHQGSFAAAHRAPNTYRESPLGEITPQRLVPVVKMAWSGKLSV